MIHSMVGTDISQPRLVFVLLFIPYAHEYNKVTIIMKNTVLILRARTLLLFD
jgi:hypothetical protein